MAVSAVLEHQMSRPSTQVRGSIARLRKPGAPQAVIRYRSRFRAQDWDLLRAAGQGFSDHGSFCRSPLPAPCSQVIATGSSSPAPQSIHS